MNLGTNEEISIKDLAELIGRLVGFEGDLEWDSTRSGRPAATQSGCQSRRRELFGFEALVPLEEGLRRTIAYYEAHPGEAEAATF